MTAAVKGIRVPAQGGIAECPQCHVEIGRPLGQEMYMCASDCGRWIPIRENLNPMSADDIKYYNTLQGHYLHFKFPECPDIQVGKIVAFIRTVRYSRLSQSDVDNGYITQAEYDQQRSIRARAAQADTTMISSIQAGARVFASGI